VTEVVAALDCGSNSTRLLIENAKGQVLRRELRITRLSQGVDASGTLEDEALARSYGYWPSTGGSWMKPASSAVCWSRPPAVRDAQPRRVS